MSYPRNYIRRREKLSDDAQSQAHMGSWFSIFSTPPATVPVPARREAWERYRLELDARVQAEVAAVAARAAAPLPSFAILFDEEAGRVRSAAPSQGSNAAASASSATSYSAYDPFAELDAEEAEAEPELLPFRTGGRSYMRPGVSRAGASPIWATGDLWEMKAGGTKGDWAGVLQEDGSIDLDAEEPDVE